MIGIITVGIVLNQGHRGIMFLSKNRVNGKDVKIDESRTTTRGRMDSVMESRDTASTL